MLLQVRAAFKRHPSTHGFARSVSLKVKPKFQTADYHDSSSYEMSSDFFSFREIHLLTRRSHHLACQ
jgi:hypothetical protein